LRCDSILNSSDRIQGSVSDLSIVANNPDAAFTATAQAGQGLRVYMLNMQENIECLTQKGGWQFLPEAENFGVSLSHFL
jgi:hypothetical protein